jgi:Effector-associated domain 10
MAKPSNPNDIIQRILNGTQTDDDVEALRQWLNSGGIQNLQVGKYNVNIGHGQNVHVGDKTYQGLDAEAIREVARAVIQGSNATAYSRNCSFYPPRRVSKLSSTRKYFQFG